MKDLIKNKGVYTKNKTLGSARTIEIELIKYILTLTIGPICFSNLCITYFD